MEIKAKKFIVIPRDALELMQRRYADLAEATEAASAYCSESGQSAYVAELRVVVSRVDRPVKVAKL